MLHHRECNLIVSNPKHKSLKYLDDISTKQLIAKKLGLDVLIDKTIDIESLCCLCFRGAALFHCYWRYSIGTHVDDEIRETIFAWDKKERDLWYLLDFVNKTEFRYCPFHMNMKTSNYNIGINRKLIKRYQISTNDMIIKFCAHISITLHHHIFHDCLLRLLSLMANRMTRDTLSKYLRLVVLCYIY